MPVHLKQVSKTTDVRQAQKSNMAALNRKYLQLCNRSRPLLNIDQSQKSNMAFAKHMLLHADMMLS